MNFDFSFNTPYGMFSDSIIIPDDQPIPTEDELDALKQQRLNNWIAIITAPPIDTQG